MHKKNLKRSYYNILCITTKISVFWDVIPSRWGRTLREKLFLHVRSFRENLFLQLQSTTSMLLVFYFAMLSVTNDKPIIFIIVRQGVPTQCSGFEITLRQNTLGRTPLDRWLSRRKYIYLNTHTTHKRQTSKPPEGFDPQPQQASDRRTTS